MKYIVLKFAIYDKSIIIDKLCTLEGVGSVGVAARDSFGENVDYIK